MRPVGGQPADEQPVGPASVVRVRPRALTEPARRALAAQRWRAPVTAVFARSFNVTAAGLVVNVASHPLGGVCQVQAAGAIGVRPGAMVAFEASERAVDVGLASTGRVPAGTFRRPESWFDAPGVADAVRPRLEAGARSLAGPEASDVGAALALVGLGAGLTPSGDDALVGMLALAWRAFGRTPALRALGASVAGGALTTDVAETHLVLACGGEFAPPVARLVEALERGRGVDDAVARVAAIGHSSGADLLAGVQVMAESLRRSAEKGRAMEGAVR